MVEPVHLIYSKVKGPYLHMCVQVDKHGKYLEWKSKFEVCVDANRYKVKTRLENTFSFIQYAEILFASVNNVDYQFGTVQYVLHNIYKYTQANIYMSQKRYSRTSFGILN